MNKTGKSVYVFRVDCMHFSLFLDIFGYIYVRWLLIFCTSQYLAGPTSHKTWWVQLLVAGSHKTWLVTSQRFQLAALICSCQLRNKAGIRDKGIELRHL